MRTVDLASLFERYAVLVFRRCLAITGTTADADDALQAVFARIQRYGLNAQPGKELAWLYTIALRCCLDLHRHRRVEHAVPSEELTQWERVPDAPRSRSGQLLSA